MSHGKESCHMCLKHHSVPYTFHVPCGWVMSHVNKSCHTWMSHVMSEWVMSHTNAACHVWMSHVTGEWIISHLIKAPFSSTHLSSQSRWYNAIHSVRATTKRERRELRHYSYYFFGAMLEGICIILLCRFRLLAAAHRRGSGDAFIKRTLANKTILKNSSDDDDDCFYYL